MGCLWRLRQTGHAERATVSVLLHFRNFGFGSLSLGDNDLEDLRRPGAQSRRKPRPLSL